MIEKGKSAEDIKGASKHHHQTPRHHLSDMSTTSQNPRPILTSRQTSRPHALARSTTLKTGVSPTLPRVSSMDYEPIPACTPSRRLTSVSTAARMQSQLATLPATGSAPLIRLIHDLRTIVHVLLCMLRPPGWVWQGYWGRSR